MCEGIVEAVTDTSITYRGAKSHHALTIQNTQRDNVLSGIYNDFHVGDIIYFSYALSKEPFNTAKVEKSSSQKFVERFEKLDDEVPISDDEIESILKEYNITDLDMKNSLQQIFDKIKKLDSAPIWVDIDMEDDPPI